MLTDLSSKIGCNGYYVFTLEDENSDILVHGIINVSVKIENNEPYQVSVSGNAKIIFETYIYI